MTKTIKTPPLIDAVHENRKIAQASARELRYLGDSLNVIGMHSLADNLECIAQKIERASKDVQDAYSVDLNRQVKHAEENSGLMLAAALAGAIQKPRNPIDMREVPMSNPTQEK